MGYNTTDNAIWNIELYLMKKYGCDTAGSDIAPLRWYINTGRASIEFLRKLINAKPFIIARRIHNAPSYDIAINNVKDYLKED